MQLYAELPIVETKTRATFVRPDRVDRIDDVASDDMCKLYLEGRAEPITVYQDASRVRSQLEDVARWGLERRLKIERAIDQGADPSEGGL